MYYTEEERKKKLELGYIEVIVNGETILLPEYAQFLCTIDISVQSIYNLIGMIKHGIELSPAVVDLEALQRTVYDDVCHRLDRPHLEKEERIYLENMQVRLNRAYLMIQDLYKGGEDNE